MGYILEDEHNSPYQQQGYDPLVAQPIESEVSQEFYRFMIDNIDIIDEVEMQLKGYVKEPQEDGTYKYKKKFQAWMNDEGVSKVKYIIWSLGVNKNTLLGNLSRDEINYKCANVKKKIALLLFSNCKKYDVNPTNKDFIVTSVTNTVHSGLSRCEHGKLSNELTRVIQRHEIQHQDMREKDSGFSINPFKNKF